METTMVREADAAESEALARVMTAYEGREPVGEILRRMARQHGDEPFIRVGDGPWRSYAELDAVTDRVAAGLASLGVEKGERIAVICGNRDEAVEMVFACAKLGVTEVPLNYHLRGEFLRYQLADCGATTLVTDGPGLAMSESLLDATEITRVVLLDDPEPGQRAASSYAELRRCGDDLPDVEIALTDLQCIMYTSGTTGMPKGCMLSHGYYAAIAINMEHAGWIIDGDRMSTACPHFHMSFQNGVLVTALRNGAKVFIQPEFHATTFMEACRQERVTMVWGLGPMAVAILAQEPRDDDYSEDLRFTTWVPLHPDRQREFERRFGGRVSCEAYGQTEAFPAAVAQWDDQSPERTTAGYPAPGFEMRAVDENDYPVPVGQPGEIVVRPKAPLMMFSGYWNKPEASWNAARTLWHHTGDLGRFDENGRITFVDRAKDALRRRGENVFCVELELAIAQHPQIAAVAISAVPSPMGDDDIKASIVFAEGDTPSITELFEFFKQTVPYFAIPRFVDIRDAMPLTATGRVRKDELRTEGITPEMIDLEALGLTVHREERRG